MHLFTDKMAEEKAPKKARKDSADEHFSPSADPFSISFDFKKMTPADLEETVSGLSWKNAPENAILEPGKGLRVSPKPGTDFWRKTFRTVPIASTSGHALLYKMPLDRKRWVAQTAFTLKPEVLYDQAGVMVFIDNEHWLKAGIEVDGDPRMSCVVTNGESDWGYLSWPTTQDVNIRVEVQRYQTAIECKLEYKNVEGDWTFLRKGPLSLPQGEESVISVGVMCCAPKKKEGEKGMEVIFHKMDVNEL